MHGTQVKRGVLVSQAGVSGRGEELKETSEVFPPLLTSACETMCVLGGHLFFCKLVCNKNTLYSIDVPVPNREKLGGG